MTKIPVTMWMNVPSFYQQDMYRAPAKEPDIDLEVIFDHGLPSAYNSVALKRN